MTPHRDVLGQVKAIPTEAFTFKAVGDDVHFEGYANKPVVDRYGEIVEVHAFEKSLPTYQRNPIMLLQHSPDQPIGTFPTLDLRADGLWVRGKIGHGWDKADEARKQVEQKVLRAMSIGFRETREGFVDRDGVYHLVEIELLEISLVSVPANQDAVFSMGADGKLLDIKLIDESASRQRSHGALARQVADLSARMEVLRSAPDYTVGDKLAEFERRLQGREAQVHDLGQAVATLLESEAARLVRDQEMVDERLSVLGCRGAS